NSIFIGSLVRVRWLIRREQRGEKRWIQWRMFIGAGGFSCGISAAAFVPGVYGYVNKLRPPYR
ncbi:hypothetical protein MMJ63_21940, partial [Bacillus vallismortis]|nr:hypothetical protein [Bacillus vallismortis]